ncbi:MAG TPA: thioredoxin domain-containing protein [Nitrospira sp.]|nr:thioredoxin domain-containing protein [Nitrospira sp.]
MTQTDSFPNRLITESSPYLRQHALNPVEWYPWGAEALSKARAENKPILLSIGYSACHWCHVMSHECFESREIAALMNEHFINVKVDREERPDLDDLYQKAAQVFLGRGGGWPLTMFLTPDQEPFYGGTYFPPVPRHNLPGFPQVLLGVVEAYRNHRQDVAKNVERVKAGLVRVSSHLPSSEPLSDVLLDDGVKDLGMFFDPVHGGFGEGPKFPTVPPLSLLLRQTYRTKETGHQEKVLHQLRAMAAGGIYDHLGGGFHRYSVDGQWLIPHFEKMLYDNAQLVRIYLDGWRLTKEPGFRQVVEETLDYVRRELMHPDGALFAAQDADSEGEEGRFFLWEPGEILAVLGQDLGQAFCQAYGVTEGGNFEGKTVLNRLGGPPLSGDDYEGFEALFRPAREKLLAAREQRVKPQRDENILTSWNALAVSALFDAYRTFGTPWYLSSAEQALTFLIDYAVADGRVFRTVTGGSGRIAGYLDDHAYLAAALLDAFETTSHGWYLEQARIVADRMLAQFWDDAVGGLFFTARDHETLIHRMKTGTDSAMPAGNAVAVQVLIRLFSLTGVRLYDERAAQTLRVFRKLMDQNAYGASALLCGLDLYLSRPLEVVIVGERGHPVTESLLAAVHQRYVPNKVLLVIDESRGGREWELPMAAGKTSVNGQPTAYVCRRSTCSTPVTDPAQLAWLL